MEAVADSPALSVNALTQAPSNATDAATYAFLSLVEDGGTTALTALSSLAATAAPVETSNVVANSPPPLVMTPPTMTPPTGMATATATPTISFVKPN